MKAHLKLRNVSFMLCYVNTSLRPGLANFFWVTVASMATVILCNWLGQSAYSVAEEKW